MPYERWGSLSVKDHTNPVLLVPELLLYDRLVIPTPSDDKEVERWEKAGWQPDNLDKLLKELGPLARIKPWDSTRREVFQKRMDELQAIQSDASDIVEEVREELPYQLTRRILAQEEVSELPDDVTNVNVVCAYQSENDFRADWYLDTNPDERSHLGMLFGHQLAVPDIKDPKDALSEAIKLSRDAEFRQARRAFYDWQLQVMRKGYDPKRAVEEMHYLIGVYNDIVKKAVRKVYLKAAFTLAGVSLGIAGATLWNPIALASSVLAVVEFATFDRKPVIEAGEAAPAAMFHDIEAKLGLKFHKSDT